MKAYLMARQSGDLRRDIASKLQFSGRPFFPRDKIYFTGQQVRSSQMDLEDHHG